MVLKDIMSISGSNGLYRFITKSRNGIIVEGLSDKKRFHSPSSAKVSALEDISVYTSERDVPLKEIFQSIFKKENGSQTIDPKSENEKLKKYFEEIVPDYDKDRVYVSDIKKIFVWYNILNSLKMVDIEIDEDNSGNKDKSDDQVEKTEE